MPEQHTYVLGLNVYDHDVSACLLRDGAIACAISKERLTREKHASGFYKEVIDYCLEAEGISLDDVDLVVRNSYIMPVDEMEERLTYQDMPGFLSPPEREQAEQHPYFRKPSDKVVTVSHHLAHAYSAFAASPFEEGAVMIVDGVGGYRSDAMEKLPDNDTGNPLARESESYYRFSGSKLECLKKVWLEPSRGTLNEEFYSMPGLGALYSRASTYVFGDWNKCGELMGLAPYGRREQFKHLLELDNGELQRAALGCLLQAALSARRRRLGKTPRDAPLGGSRLAGAGRHRKRSARPHALAARDDRGEESLPCRWRGAELRRQRPHRPRGRL